MSENKTLNQRLDKTQQDNEQQLLQIGQLAGENSQKNAELKLREEEVQRLKQEISRVNKVRDGLSRKLKSVEDQKAAVEGSRESLKQQMGSLERGEEEEEEEAEAGERR